MSSEKREASPEASPLKGPAPKAVPEDTSDVAFEDGIPLSPMAADPSVQFISGTPANGDAKVEIGDSGIAPTFVGLGKEELMKYANDPFWVRLRWFLFILFWVLWLAMLVGAIVIIILAPRCAEKKMATETFYQIKAADLIKDNEQIDAQTQYLKDMGVMTVIISDVLKHDPSSEPEAVTDLKALDETINEDVFTATIKKMRNEGMTVLMQLVPNHVAITHEWFNDLEKSDYFVREPYNNVSKSVWVTQDRKGNAWTVDPNNDQKAYLHQFSGNVADLNFRNDDIISYFKGALSDWRLKKIDGFVISKASFLVENLDNLMSSEATRNSPKNVEVIKQIVGITSGPVLVELDLASEETINQYIGQGLTPVVKSVDTANASRIEETLEVLSKIPDVVINLSPKPPSTPEKARLINLLAIAGGSHALLNHESAQGDKEFLKNLVKFQQDNPKVKSTTVQHSSIDNFVAVLRSDGDDRHLIIANVGNTPATFSPQGSNITESAAGKIILATPNAGLSNGSVTQDEVSLPMLSGVIIKLGNKPSE
ncbi:unnamed protein product [Orchesella dallaii]|uniref:alpha-glucosidase n=1 Tax=Orchesella dallaii TaxID=48710 RepID=A0ABP1R8F9_9HEXA